MKDVDLKNQKHLAIYRAAWKRTYAATSATEKEYVRRDKADWAAFSETLKAVNRSGGADR